MSIWSLLGAVAIAGLCAVAGVGWLLWSRGGAVNVFAREVGRAAVLPLGAASMASVPWALHTGLAPVVWGHGWAGVATVTLAASSLGLLVAHRATLWNRRAALPAACGLLAATLALAAALAALLPVEPTAAVARGSFPSYLAVLLLIGSPLVVADLLRRRRALVEGGAAIAPRSDQAPHAGRRSGALANNLHLS